MQYNAIIDNCQLKFGSKKTKNQEIDWTSFVQQSLLPISNN